MSNIATVSELRASGAYAASKVFAEDKFDLKPGAWIQCEYWKWLKDAGIYRPDVTLEVDTGRDNACPVDGYRGLHVTAPQAHNDVLVRVPLNRVLTSELGQNDCYWGRRLKESGVQFRPQIYLTLYLLQERRKGVTSKWAAYLRTLPHHYPDIPLCWTPAELAKLEGSCFFPGLVALRRKLLAEEYHRICSVATGFALEFDFEDFMWAMLVVITRPAMITRENTEVLILIPLLDMFNHRTPKNTSWDIEEDEAGQASVVRAEGNLLAGQEIFLSYNDNGKKRKGNAWFLLNYGFCMPDNPDDTVYLRLAIDVDDEQSQEKLTLLCHCPIVFSFFFPTASLPSAPRASITTPLSEQQSPPAEGTGLSPPPSPTVDDSDSSKPSLACFSWFLCPPLQLACVYQHPLTQLAFAFLRFKHQTEVAASLLSLVDGQEQGCVDDGQPKAAAQEERSPDLSLYLRPLSVHNELAVLSSLEELCSHILETHPSPELSDNPTANEASAMLLVRGEQRILNYYVSLCNSITSFVYRKRMGIGLLFASQGTSSPQPFHETNQDAQGYFSQVWAPLLR